MRELKYRVYIPEKNEMVYFDFNEFPHSDRYLYSDKYPVQEYTGLTDKNGNPIFEDDIVKWGDLNYLVEWNDIAYKWQGRCPYYHTYHHPTTENFRDLMNGIIVGNILEHSELLK